MILPLIKNSCKKVKGDSVTVNEIFSAPIFLAPMAGVTDSAFRLIVRELTIEKNLMFAEMVSCNGIHFKNFL